MLSLQLQTTSRHSASHSIGTEALSSNRHSAARTPPGVPGLPVAVEPVRAVGREEAAMPKKQEGAQKAPVAWSDIDGCRIRSSAMPRPSRGAWRG